MSDDDSKIKNEKSSVMYRFLGVDFILDPAGQPAEVIKKVLGIDITEWSILRKVKLFRIAKSSSEQQISHFDHERLNLAERLLLLCSLFHAWRRIETPIESWLLSHPGKAEAIEDPPQLFCWASGVVTDFNFRNDVDARIKNGSSPISGIDSEGHGHHC